MNFLKMVLVFFSSLYVFACSTTYKDFKTSNVQPNEGVVIGKVNIIYNGKNKNQDCAVCFDSIDGPCQSLTAEGIVFQNIPQGVGSVSRISCKDTSSQHFNIEGAVFHVIDGVNYIGQVDIGWANSGGFKMSDLFGAVGNAITESRNDGAIRILVTEGDERAVVEAFELQTRRPLKMEKIYKSLVSPVGSP